MLPFALPRRLGHRLSYLSFLKTRPARMSCVFEVISLLGGHGQIGSDSDWGLALRQQVAVWKARQPRPRLTEMDRIFSVLLSRRLTLCRDSLQVVRRETVVGWHRFRRY